MTWIEENSKEKISVIEEIDKLYFSEMTREDLILKLNTYSPINGEIVVSASYYNYGDDCCNGFLKISNKRLETESEFHFRLSENTRRLRNKEREQREKYERLKLIFEKEAT